MSPVAQSLWGTFHIQSITIGVPSKSQSQKTRCLTCQLVLYTIFIVRFSSFDLIYSSTSEKSLFLVLGENNQRQLLILCLPESWLTVGANIRLIKKLRRKICELKCPERPWQSNISLVTQKPCRKFSIV
jgi:hypothetical protein